MVKLRLGSVVRSTRGHDAGQLFMVVGQKGAFAQLADGKFKLLKNPKLKNLSHLVDLNYVDEEISIKLNNGQKINDQMIYHSLFMFKKIEKEEN